MSPKERQTTPNFDVLRAQHAPMGSPDLDWCACGIPWPCDFIRADDERRKLLAVVEAARRASDKRTLMDDGFWISKREMRYIDDALAALDEVQPDGDL